MKLLLRLITCLSLAAALRGELVEPALQRARLTVAPTDAQLAALPPFPARWVIRADLAARLPALLAQAGFRPDFAAELTARLRPLPETGDRGLTPDRALLARFTPAERAQWHTLLAFHFANLTSRWPLSLGPAELAALGAEPRWAEALARLRASGLPHGDRLVCADLFALEGAFATPADRAEFFGLVLGADALVLKLRRTQGRPFDAAAEAAWWQVNGRLRSIEPLLAAVTAIPDAPRLDLGYLLPRLPRGLLNTFPPALARAPDPGVESSVLASDFFSLAPGADPNTEPDFRTWLARECVPADGPPRYGDLHVYGDPDRTPWPYTAVYLAGGAAFARRPTLFGPWQILDLAEIGRLNPRFAGITPRVFRLKTSLPAPDEPPFLPGRMTAAWRARLRLETVPAGPWGRLRYYRVLLAPAGDTLERLPAPDPAPAWTFVDLTPAAAQAAADRVSMPAGVRAELRALFADATPAADGRFTVHPSLDLVLATPRAFRAAVFPHLVGGEAVTDYAQHIPFPAGFTLDEWFEAGALPETVRQALLGLVYPFGDRFRLSDFGALYATLGTRAEQLAAHRAALREPAVVVLLERPRPEEVPALAEYWRRTGRAKSTRRLLEAFAASDLRYLDILHLLSPVEREFLYTYFTPAGPSRVPSCFWTSFNFGAEQPDDRHLVVPGVWSEHEALAWRELQARYDPIAAPARLGDIVAYHRKGAAAIEHMCVFIAGGLVLSKNGATFSHPWVLAPLAEIDALYLREADHERVHFRPRGE